MELLGNLWKNLTNVQRKFIFFYLIFNLIGYLSFLLDLHPKIAEDYNEKSFSTIYLITPKKGHSQHFWPFHSFYKTFGYEGDEGGQYKIKQEYNSYTNSFTNTVVEQTKYFEFFGLWGYYDHKEFIVYVILTFIGLVFYVFYKTKVTT